MSKSIGGNLFKFILSLFGSEEKSNSVHMLKNVKNEKDIHNENKLDNESAKRIWGKEYNPLRKLILWGWDENNNPSFLILYGRQQFKQGKQIREGYRLLEETVKYNCYAVFKGQCGHLPSFKSVKIIDKEDDGNFKMYFTKGVKYNWNWRLDDKYIVKGFQTLKPGYQISFPYSANQSQEQYVHKIIEQGINFEGFKLARNPREVLRLNEKLSAELNENAELLIDIMGSQNLYMRKKKLNELLYKNPSKEVLVLVLDIGSTELISGLFLELAKRGDPVLIDEAKVLLLNEINWADADYAKGVKRCTQLYVNALNDDIKMDRIKWIRKFISDVDLHIRFINDKEVSEDKIFDGYAYRKKAILGFFNDTYGRYDYDQEKKRYNYITYEAPKRYKTGAYTDGVKLKLIDLKNTIQESEIYGLADVIGKAAYYLDAPRLTYYFKGSGRTKAFKYFHRYIKRVINSYAENDPEKFMAAMKKLLTSYTKYDYVCKYRDNFQFNDFIRYYLYYDFKEKPPVGWENWSKRYDWMVNDHLMKINGRYEFAKKIWDNNLDIAAEIAIESKINQVVKACYYILKDSPNSNSFIQNIKYKQLIGLSHVEYEPLSKMFKEILTARLEQVNTFNPQLMLALMECNDKYMHEYAIKFFKRTNGVFSVQNLIEILNLENVSEWAELLKSNFQALSSNQYVEFIKYIFADQNVLVDINNVNGVNKANDVNNANGVNTVNNFNNVLPDNILEMLYGLTDKVKDADKAEKVEIVSNLVDVLFSKKKLPEWMGTLIEELIFSFSEAELEELLLIIPVESFKGVNSARNRRVLSLVDSIKNKVIPSDAQIIDILNFGSSKMVKMLINIIYGNSEQLKDRFSTLLIMLESDITVLNKKAEEVFESMDSENRKKLHLIIIDSPVKRAYSFGLKKLDDIYGELIPEEFIIQMLEHGALDVKAYISDKTEGIIDKLSNENVFMYYLRTLLYLPNRISKSKDKLYRAIPKFAAKYKNRTDEVESILLDIGGSNLLVDSERALVALANIRENKAARRKIGGGKIVDGKIEEDKIVEDKTAVDKIVDDEVRKGEGLIEG